MHKANALSSIDFWADRSGDKATCAIRADVVQHAINAVGAEGALVAANPRLGGVWRQVFVAHLAIGA
jgi:hypothetical protein